MSVTQAMNWVTEEVIKIQGRVSSDGGVFFFFFIAWIGYHNAIQIAYIMSVSIFYSVWLQNFHLK